MRLTRRALLLGIFGSAALGGCLSPTLPLPPPQEPTVEQLGQNQYLLSGTVPAPGHVNVLNLRTERIDGQAVHSDRQYSFVVEAQRDDRMRIWYTDDNELSQYTEFVIERLLTPSDSAPDGGAPDAAR